MPTAFSQLVPAFKNVGPGLNDVKPLVATTHDDMHNCAQIDSPSNFRLFTWFFVVPRAPYYCRGSGSISSHVARRTNRRPRKLALWKSDAPDHAIERHRHDVVVVAHRTVVVMPAVSNIEE